MSIPLMYNLRNMWNRRLTTILTVSGLSLVVYVFAAILMLAAGLEKTLIETGCKDNVVVIRKGSASEVMSSIERRYASIVEMLPQITVGINGQRLFAKEIVILIALQKISSNKPSNVTLRGIGENSLALRPQIKIISGRTPRIGSLEVMVGQSIAKGFKDINMNATFRGGQRIWEIVGIFDAGNTGFSSEIWGDVDQFMQAFRRPVYSSLIFNLRKSSDFSDAKALIESDPRMNLEVKRETQYYLDQSEMMAKFLRILGMSLTIIFSMGAVIGAMITMYAAVANRTSEIGTLRAIGFKQRDILLAFLIEALLYGFFGGITGIFFAAFMQLITVSTINFQTFSELAFNFSLSSGIILQSITFSLVMGLIGGVLPAFRASHMNIVSALRTK